MTLRVYKAARRLEMWDGDDLVLVTLKEFQIATAYFLSSKHYYLS